MDEGGESTGRWQLLFRQLFESHPANVALLDPEGTILAVNAGWREYGRANGIPYGYDMVGRNYLAVCEAGAAADYPMAREAYVGLLEVLKAGRPKFTLVYPCHTPTRREWYRMWVEPQTPTVPVVIVAHQFVSSEPAKVVEPTTFRSWQPEPTPRRYDARQDSRRSARGLQPVGSA